MQPMPVGGKRVNCDQQNYLVCETHEAVDEGRGVNIGADEVGRQGQRGHQHDGAEMRLENASSNSSTIWQKWSFKSPFWPSSLSN